MRFQYRLLLSIQFIAILFLSSFSRGEVNPNFQLSWPTPNPAFAQGMGYSAFLQKTGPDKAFSSGAFGCVRNNGYKFHEGLDLYPVKRDSRGKAEDSIYAAMEGVVVHANNISGHSAYGKYVVLEHDSVAPTLYSLYGHLDSIDPALKKGVTVKVAQKIGKMGNSASYRIPLNRSHLHFEIGLRLTDNFQSWYNTKKFSSLNRHGNYSGFNLVGIDPLPFYAKYRAKAFKTPLEYINSLPNEAKIRIRTKKIPDFAKRYPELCSFFPRNKSWNGWECIFGPYGLPLKLQQTDGCKKTDPFIKIISYDIRQHDRQCRRLVERSSGRLVPAEQLELYIELLFGVTLG